jgi:hypothetical protein
MNRRTYKVLKVNKCTATVSTRGLCRVVIQSDGEVIWELCSLRDAKACAGTYNACKAGNTRAVIQKYPQ